MKTLSTVVSGLFLLFAAASAQAADSSDAANRRLQADAVCTKCHDETETKPIFSIYQTPHGVVGDERSPTCTSCHGESKQHIAGSTGGGEGSKRPVPDVVQGRTHTTSGYEPSDAPTQSAQCMNCHESGLRTHWTGSQHQVNDLACSSCHRVHVAKDPILVKTEQETVCFTCHKEQRVQMNRPVHHPVPEGAMACSSCHNVHGGNPKQLVRDSVTETCFTCHMEKRGPFVHNHPPVQEDCAICHQPHGTTIPSLLKARPPFLCQECHSHSSHPSQAGTLPSGRTTTNSLLGSVARGCLNCHTNIHGSNSTQNSATSGRFRR